MKTVQNRCPLPGLPRGDRKKRGERKNPKNRFSPFYTVRDEPEKDGITYFEEEARSILTKNDSPDVGFRYSINPYRGCTHGCIYCYARPTHEYLDLGMGTDFERKIVVKRNAVELLKKEIRNLPEGEVVVLSGVTDPYQPCEHRCELTRKCLQVLRDRHPYLTIITKGTLIRRDLSLLEEIHKKGVLRIFISLPFLTEIYYLLFEPEAPSPEERLKTIQELSQRGIPVGVAVAPLIPGISEGEIGPVLTRAYESGARYTFTTLLRLPYGLKTYFFQRLKEAEVSWGERIQKALKKVRGGKIYTGDYFERMVGNGERWEVLKQLFTVTAKKIGYSLLEEEPKTPVERQLTLPCFT